MNIPAYINSIEYDNHDPLWDTIPHPYHINNYKEGLFHILYSYAEVTNQLPLYIIIQPKYDGTHLQLIWHNDKLIIRKHSGKLADNWQIDGYLKLDKMTRLSIEEWLQHHEGICLDAELFGSAYTPTGIHRDYPKEWDIVVFEVGANRAWLPYTRWDNYKILSRVHWALQYNIEQLLDHDNRQALIDLLSNDSLGDYYEGWVIKAYITRTDKLKDKEYKKTVRNYMSYNLWITKLKPIPLTPSDDWKTNAFIEEILNELHKHNIDPTYIFKDMPMQIYNDHPILMPSDKYGQSKVYIKALSKLVEKYWGV